ncbi:MAG TPA: hypothetical protein VGQ62_02870, partial [Chloroflexota bacterium]|nr:hypothetical protein [Chloroflexota bacterium]
GIIEQAESHRVFMCHENYSARGLGTAFSALLWMLIRVDEGVVNGISRVFHQAPRVVQRVKR